MSDEPKIFVHVDSSEVQGNIPEYNQDLPCGKCNAPTETGFGLAGGGFGIYSYCTKCGQIVSKSVTED